MKKAYVVVGSGLLALLVAVGLPAAATLSKGDEAFLKMAAEANMTEAHVGQVAAQQGTLQGVKDLGQTMVTDHTDAYQELTELADKLGVTIPKGIDIAKDRAIERLIHMKGASFDRDFARLEVASHREAIAAFQRESEHGDNADIRAYAKKTIPVLEKHLHMAEEILKTGPRG